MSPRPLAVVAGVLAAACQQAQTAPLYEKVPVEHRDIVVTVLASGVIQPTLTFSVKSKAWGEIIAMPVQTGDEVKKGQVLASIDPRIPRDNLTQAEAMLAKAQAQLDNATAQLKRSQALYESKSIAETDYEGANLAYTVAKAAVVTAQASLQAARDAMEDTQVRAPIAGTVLELDAVRGTVISSPTLGGGTVILKMANLDTAQDSAMVAETDIAKVQPGIPVTISVDAYPNRSFEGVVLKIGPQAQVVQNVTMFPVFVNVPNPGHLLKPGMNTDVRIHTGQEHNVLVIPNAALRTQRDVASGAGVLGLDPQVVQQELVAAETAARPRRGGDTAAHGASGETITTPNGRTMTLPPGVTAEEVRNAFAKVASGAELTAAERSLLAQVRGGGAGRARGFGAGRGVGGGRLRNGGGNAGSYIVFAIRSGKPVAIAITTGLTDQDYIEVTSGLTDRDTVLVLPSASLVQAQQQFKQRFQSVTGGGLPGVRQQSQSAPTR